MLCGLVAAQVAQKLAALVERYKQSQSQLRQARAEVEAAGRTLDEVRGQCAAKLRGAPRADVEDAPHSKALCGTQFLSCDAELRMCPEWKSCAGPVAEPSVI